MSTPTNPLDWDKILHDADSVPIITGEQYRSLLADIRRLTAERDALKEECDAYEKAWGDELDGYRRTINQYIIDVIGPVQPTYETINGKQYASYKGMIPRLQEIVAERDNALRQLAAARKH